MAGFTFKLQTKYIEQNLVKLVFADLYIRVTKTRDK